ncbi:MAG TPA: hypothetical protein VK421_06120 [Pyrinomonadaceae bacterium]|nr:hypothetical protein [Pyrinomonadaceae bacterium]
MRIQFDTLTRRQIAEAVTGAKKEADKWGAADNLLFYDGEHFDKGRFWTGPQPADGDRNNPASYDKVEKEFASKNAVRDITDGHRDGVVSREIEWALTVRRPLAKKGEILDGRELTEDEKPNEKEQALIREAQAALTVWWNERRMLKVFQDATETLLKTTRAPMRLFIPPAEVGENGMIPTAPLEESLEKIFVEALPYDQATVLTDPYSRRQAGVFAVKDGEEEVAEITYLNDAKETVWKVLRDENNPAVPYTPQSSYQSIFSATPRREADAEPATFDLGGRLLIYEMRRKPFITPQIVQSNKQLNKAKTLRGHNLNTAGFAETTLLNVDLPGKIVTQPDGSQKFVPDPIKRGPPVINAWTGFRWTDGEGKEHVEQPYIERSEPSPVDVFIGSERADYRDILEESKQVHTLIAGDAQATGVSRVQARGGFALSLNPTKGEVDAACRWALETVLAMAATLSGQPGRFDSLRANADCRIDTGPVTPEEVTMYVSLWEKGVWSKERVQRATGVEDTDQENTLIEAARVRMSQLTGTPAAPDSSERPDSSAAGEKRGAQQAA